MAKKDDNWAKDGFQPWPNRLPLFNRWRFGLAQQTRSDDGLSATTSCPLSPSERRGGRRIVCSHRFHRADFPSFLPPGVQLEVSLHGLFTGKNSTASNPRIAERSASREHRCGHRHDSERQFRPRSTPCRARAFRSSLNLFCRAADTPARRRRRREMRRADRPIGRPCRR
jgi:hypothetical protein